MIDTVDSPVKDLWRIFRVMAEFTEGFEELASVKPAVSIFGSSRTRSDSPFYQLAEQTASELAKAGFAVLARFNHTVPAHVRTIVIVQGIAASGAAAITVHA